MVDGEIPAALASAFTVNCFWLQSSRILFATACFVFNLLTTLWVCKKIVPKFGIYRVGYIPNPTFYVIMADIKQKA